VGRAWYELAVRELDADVWGPIHYTDHGGEGPPLVLIHGLGGSRLNWRGVAAGLATRHRVYAIEFIGHGLTPIAGRVASLANHQRLIDAFLDGVVGGPATLVGNSTGGHLAILEAALHPEKVSGLVLVDPAVPIPVRGGGAAPVLALGAAPMLIRGVGEALMMANARRMSSEAVVYRTLKLVAADPSRIPRELVDLHLEGHRERHGNEDANRAYLQTGRSLLAGNLRRGRFYGLVGRVKAPTLIVHGRRDRLVPLRAVEKLIRLRPDWELHVFDELGHVPMLEDPALFNEVVLRWLGQQAAAAA